MGRIVKVKGIAFLLMLLSFLLFYNIHAFAADETIISTNLTLDSDKVIIGNLKLAGGTLNLNGKVLTVHGNFVQVDGNLLVGGGKLIVDGNYYIATINADGSFYNSAGTLTMTNDLDYVSVGGSFHMYAILNHDTRLTAGTLEVKGDFIQEHQWNVSVSQKNFSAGGTHKVILSGTTAQNVSFTSPGIEKSAFNILEIKNTSQDGVNFSTNGFVKNELCSTDSKVTNSSNLYITGNAILSGSGWKYDLGISGIWNLAKDQIIEGNLTAGSLNLNGYSLTVRKDYKPAGTVNLQKGTLTVSGNLLQGDSNVNIGGGKLMVGGYYYVANLLDGSLSCSSGTLIMTNDSDYVSVGGSFYMFSIFSHDTRLTAGTLEVKGDFTQEKHYSVTDSKKNFFASGTHKVILSGTSLQKVHFSSPGLNYSAFNNFEINNMSTDGVEFNSDILINGEVKAKGVKINGYDKVYFGGSAIVNAEEWPYNIVTKDNWKLQAGVSMYKDFYINGGILDLNGHTLTVNKNLIISTGTIKVNGGILNVKGDFRLQAESVSEDGTVSYELSEGMLNMTNDLDRVNVNGDFVMGSVISHQQYLSAGTLSIKGNFLQKSPNSCNFYASGTNKVIMAGTGLQEVDFQTPGKTQSHFSMLELENNSVEGVIFKSALITTRLFEHNQKKYTLSSTGEFVDYDLDGIKDNEDPYPEIYDPAFPFVTYTDPVEGDKNILVGKTITVGFSKDLKTGEDYGNIQLKSKAGIVAASNIDFSGRKLTIKPLEALEYYTDYIISIPAAAFNDLSKDVNPLQKDYSIGFTTELDTYPPYVVSVDPADKQDFVHTDKVITVTFNEKMSEGKDFKMIQLVEASTGTIISTDISINSKTLTIRPINLLKNKTKYVILLPAASVYDLASNSLKSDIKCSFVTVNEGTVWEENRVLEGNAGDGNFAGVYEFDNLGIADNIEITSKGVSQIVIKVNGTLTLGKNAVISVRNGYSGNSSAPLNSISAITSKNLDSVGTLENGVRLYNNTYGKGGDGGKGGYGEIGTIFSITYGVFGINDGGDGGQGGEGGFGGGKGGEGGTGAKMVSYYNPYPNKSDPWVSAAGNDGHSGRDNAESLGTSAGISVGGITNQASGHGSGGFGGQGNGGTGGCYGWDSARVSGGGVGGGGGGGGGYGGGILTIIADKIDYDPDNPPLFLVSGQKGGKGYNPAAGFGQNGEGGLLIIKCNNYMPSSNQWSLDLKTYSFKNPPSVNGGHGTLTGNPQRVFVNGIDLSPGLQVEDVKINSLTSDKKSPQELKNIITWTCTAAGGKQLYYRFLSSFDNGVTWSIEHEYSTSNKFVWIPVEKGKYLIKVQVRDIISDKDCDAETQSEFVINPQSPVSLSVNTSNAILDKGKTIQITVTAKMKDGSLIDATSICTWVSSNTAVAAVDKGLIMAVSGGKSVIKAVIGTKSITVNVTVNPTAVSLTSNVKAVYLEIGKKISLKLTVTYDTGKTQTVTTKAAWTNSNTSTAIVTSGAIKAVAIGTTVVKASYGGISLEIPVSVIPVLSKLQAQVTSVDAQIGDIITAIPVTAAYIGYDPQDVTACCAWTSSSSKTASVNLNGVISANSKGTTSITAIYGSKKVTIKINIIPKIQELRIEANSSQLNAGKLLYPKAVLYFNNNTHTVLTSKVVWSSDNPAIAEVNKSSGAIKGISKGEATITATFSIWSGSYSAAFKVKVDPVLVKLTALPITVKVNDLATPSIIASYIGDVDQSISLADCIYWKSSNKYIVTVDNNGLVIGIKKGTATISAIYNKKTITIKVTVID